MSVKSKKPSKKPKPVVRHEHTGPKAAHLAGLYLRAAGHLLRAGVSIITIPTAHLVTLCGSTLTQVGDGAEK